MQKAVVYDFAAAGPLGGAVHIGDDGPIVCHPTLLLLGGMALLALSSAAACVLLLLLLPEAAAIACQTLFAEAALAVVELALAILETEDTAAAAR